MYLYIIFTIDLVPLLSSSVTHAQLYADEAQAYQHCLTADDIATVCSLSWTTGALGSWMSSKRICLSLHKIQFIWLCTR